ncbi:hypothetical protein HOU00_gp201 [Caulobacter phage CcrPW]|uniref:Uncharacterized protein n=1 Tax=Caulobacter phage CcrPW TaxID=2283271 RepID=A0A385EAN7_9CAUD|nr:hypothetical protein HOU00_gp201 [Caulobacter phage CcrPW]AXQ68924.1 hypothetical protein CcrPW_gp385c [Caulobacter phage CcrPW]
MPEVETHTFKLDPKKQGLPPVPDGYLYVKRGEPLSAVYVPAAHEEEGAMRKNDMQERHEAFEAWKAQGGTYPPGVDRIVLDIAFKAGWEAHKNRRKKVEAPR